MSKKQPKTNIKRTPVDQVNAKITKRSRLEKVAELANAGMFERPPGIVRNVAMQAEPEQKPYTPPTLHQEREDVEKALIRRMASASYEGAANADWMRALTSALVAVRG